MCLAWLVQPLSRLLALMWFARRVPIRPSGSTPVTQQKVLPPRRPTARHHAISTSATVTPYGVFLSLWRCNRAPQVAAITIAKLLSGGCARLRSILGGALAGLEDAAVDHDGPSDPAQSCWRSQPPPAFSTCGPAAS
jgi:hypothetical protein